MKLYIIKRGNSYWAIFAGGEMDGMQIETPYTAQADINDVKATLAKLNPEYQII